MWASTTPVPEGREVRRAAALDAFLRMPASAVRQFWSGRSGPRIVTATDGTTIGFQAMRSDQVPRSEDGERTWAVRSRWDPPPTWATRWWTRQAVTCCM